MTTIDDTTYLLIWRKIKSEKAIEVLLRGVGAFFQQGNGSVACTIYQPPSLRKTVRLTMSFGDRVVESCVASIVCRVDWAFFFKKQGDNWD